MVKPIVLYDNPILRQVAVPIERESFDTSIINDMFDTLQNATGVGLAAPQIGLSIRLFIVDFEEHSKVFINPIKLSESGLPKIYNEGCLSLPTINMNVIRPGNITLSYYDEHWNHFETTFDGAIARIVQHEYDHLEGKFLFDHVLGVQKIMLAQKLQNIRKKKIRTSYPTC